MELKQQALELKSRLINSVEIWAEERVDSFVSGNTAFKPLGKYLKRGVHNILVQKDKEITEKVEGFMLFAADENGNYDKEELFDDAMNVFKSMKPYKFEQGFLKGTIGEGSILIELPGCFQWLKVTKMKANHNTCFIFLLLSKLFPMAQSY